MIKVLFVCLGNICRSPMAEGVFKDLIEKEGVSCKFSVDSAGTSGYHIDQLADPRMRDVANSKGIKLTSRSRKLVVADLLEFDYIVAMDESNYEDIKSLEKENHSAKVVLMREYDDTKEGINVPDPYYGGIEGFEDVYQILLRSNRNFLRQLCTEHDLSAD